MVSIRRIFQNELKLRPYRFQKVHFSYLTPNDRGYGYLTEDTHEDLSLRTAIRSNFPSHVMVWATVAADARFFYRENVLEAVLKPQTFRS